jgi:tRNA(fMet)-specific endonuclease VapC
MSLFVLDTDILTMYQLGHAAVVQHVAARQPCDLAITVISVEEQLSGWYRRLRQARKPHQLANAYQRLTKTVESLSGWQILSFIEPAIHRYDQLRASGLNIRKMDLRIAAIALENGAAVVTRNRQDFQRVPGLSVEDWSH